MATIFTIGHSTRTLDELIEVLRAHGIKTLVDIRAFPMSRRLPHFNRENLEQALPANGIEYVWEPALGGRRRKLRDDSPNTALRNDSFRNYADYMLTAEFRRGVSHVLDLAGRSPTAIMCAERMYFQCHRMLVSDWLAIHGHRVLHIVDTGPVSEHRPMPEAQLVGDDLIYNGGRLF